MELIWETGISTSALHAVDLVHGGCPLADPRLEAAIAPLSGALSGELDAGGLEWGPLFEHLLALSSQVGGNRALAETALAKAAGPAGRGVAECLAGRIADIEAALIREVPDIERQLAARREPLRLQWEARGPGMLGEIGRLTDPALLVETARVVILLPVLGGAGRAHLRYNRVSIEGVLADPHADLPETVRLAWLLSQLQLDLPAYSESIDAGRQGRVAQLAMIPPVLRAAEAVELSRFSRALVERALTAWRVDAKTEAPHTATVLLDWWATYVASRPRWAVALTALDRMLPADETGEAG